jgi:hypothetical protein
VVGISCLAMWRGFGVVAGRAGVPYEILTGISAAAVGQFILLQIPLWFLRGASGLQIVDAGAIVPGADSPRLSLRQILAVVTVIAILLAILRDAYGRIAIVDGQVRTLGLVTLFTMIVAFDLLLAGLAMWGFLSPRARHARMLLASGVAVAVTLFQNFVFVQVISETPTWFIILWLNLPQFTLLAATFLATRLAGFALITQRN